MSNLSHEDKMRDVFLILGSSYFAHARYTVQFISDPICATLFHHAIEMLIKGYLSFHESSKDLKKFGHDLTKLWEKFKQYSGDAKLTKFDNSIKNLDKVEFLRYPDAIVDEGFALHISLGAPNIPFFIPGTDISPQYYLNVSDIDAITILIFAACSVNPVQYFKNVPTAFQDILPAELRRLI